METFKFISTFFIWTLLFQSSCKTKSENSIKVAAINKDTSFNKLNGLYVGLEEMGALIDPSKPKWKWYHLSYLKIKGDSVFLDQSPISIYKTDTSFSASDGGFYYYSGTLISSDTTVEINLKETSCDYCGELMKKNADGTLEREYRTKKYLGKLTDKGIIINGYLFTKTNKSEF